MKLSGSTYTTTGGNPLKRKKTFIIFIREDKGTCQIPIYPFIKMLKDVSDQK